jgi:uncharacterized repeat protein (TIGR01451 family)
MALVLSLMLLPAREVQADTYTVTTTADSGDGSLRWAIEQANANLGPDTIQFNIAGCGGVCTLQPESALPTLADDETTLEGYSQPGASPATADDSAILLVEIDGSLAGAGVPGIWIASDDNVIRGLSITNFGGAGIALGPGDGNTVAGNYLGLDPLSTPEGNDNGVLISVNAQENLIGGDTPAERNVISGNDEDGVRIKDSGVMSNTVAGNYIGTSPDGASALANGSVGVHIYSSAKANTVGPDNVISGNTWEGVKIEGVDTMRNTVTGNIIGADVEGTSALPNHYGIFVAVFAQHNIIGPDNIISGNERHGVDIHSVDAMSNTVMGNVIGADITGRTALPNGENGVYLSVGAQHNIIGPDNVISGNGQDGVYIVREGVDHNTITDNYIGTTADGMGALGNTRYGVYIGNGPRDTWVTGNVISANDHGVWIEGKMDGAVVTRDNVVNENLIGVAADGIEPLGNTHDGVHISVLGQSNSVAANLIAYNGDNGVAVDTPTAFDNLIWMNSIHDNDGLGIDLTNGANHDIGAPTIYDFDLGTMTVSGKAPPESTVQIFASPDGDGEGERFLWMGTAGPAGDFDIALDALPYPYLTATATDTEDGTSEFSDVFTVTMPVLATSTKTVTAPHPMPGQPLTYTITLTNTGTDASSAKLTDTLPAEVAWTDDYSVSTGTLTWDDGKNRLLWNGTVSVDTSATIVYRVTVSETVTDGTTITNTATVDDGLFNVHELGPARVTMDFESVYLPLVMRN